jgi:2-polyprenyl-6-methoxyphenol hydroxylase-like FAD-dependent oxidoreductase
MTGQVDVLIVGAGPTGLALAAQLAAHGVRPRLVDRGHDRVHESRALAIQPRTLEVLAGFGVTEELLARGNQAVRLHMHVRHRVLTLPMFDLGLDDTAYPHLLFLSQAETEDILQRHLQTSGVAVERGVDLVDLSAGAEQVTGRLRHDDGRDETVAASYVVGCDGAHSTVRRAAGIPFEGSSYPQTFVLADVEVLITVYKSEEYVCTNKFGCSCTSQIDVTERRKMINVCWETVWRVLNFLNSSESV